MAPKGSAPNPNDVFQAQINVSMARVQDIVSSWLPPSIAKEPESQSSSSQLAMQDSELFKPAPTRLGIGAPIPPDWIEGGSKSQKDLFNDQLRRRLMSDRKHKTPTKTSLKSCSEYKRLSNGHQRHTGEGSESDEAGRSSLGKSKRHKVEASVKEEHSKAEANGDRYDNADSNGTTARIGSPSHVSSATARRHGLFLDVYTNEKNLKKKTKKRNRKGKN